MKTNINHKHKVTIGLFFCLLLVAPPLLAQRAQRPGYRAGMVHRPQIGMDLDLTDDQKEQLQDIRLEQAKALNPLRNELNENRARHRSLMQSEVFDKEAVFANIDERTALLNEIGKLQAEYHEQFRNLLTEDQKLLMILKQDQRKPRNAFRHGKRWGQRNPFPVKRTSDERPYHRFRKGAESIN